MGDISGHSRHLFRAAGLFVAGLGAFLVIRALLVPEGFGALGHYRPGALDDARSTALVFAGQEACEDCHDDVARARQGSRHATVRCEACHGALAAHAADPSASVPEKPDPGALCLVCHEKNAARPSGFPQVDPAEHAGGAACADCHKPHHPEL